MKKIVGVLALAALTTGAAWAETSVGVSVSVNEPGFYGRIEIGDRPAPRVVYTQPVVIVPSRVAVYQRPIYMHVPPGHQKNWSKHCGRYAACGQPVYFVRDDWVQEHMHDHGDHHGRPRPGRADGGDRGHGGGHHVQAPDRGNGHGPSKGHGRGRGKD